MPLILHPTRCWDWCLPEDEKEEKETIFIDKVGKSVSVVYDLGVLEHFRTYEDFV